MSKVRVRINVTPGSGVQIDGQTYGHGQVAEVSAAWAAKLVFDGRAVLVEGGRGAVQAQDPELEHRDPAPAKRGKKQK